MKFFFFFLFFPAIVFAHPSIGIVKDSKGAVYYTDLQQVWKVGPDGKKTIAVPNVHTHELYMDAADNLFGQHSSYSGEETNQYSHYIWRLRADGVLDTVKQPTEGFFIEDYSFARDAGGTMYWVQHGREDRIMKTTPQGVSVSLASGAFKDVQWLLPHAGRVYLVQDDALRYVDTSGTLNTLAKNLSGQAATKNAYFGLWAGADNNLYVANATQHTVQQISPDGTVRNFYRSKGTWFPSGGVFDNKGVLWLLEYNEANEARVVKVDAENKLQQQGALKPKTRLLLPLGILTALLAGLVVLVKKSRRPAV